MEDTTYYNESRMGADPNIEQLGGFQLSENAKTDAIDRMEKNNRFSKQQHEHLRNT